VRISRPGLRDTRQCSQTGWRCLQASSERSSSRVLECRNSHFVHALSREVGTFTQALVPCVKGLVVMCECTNVEIGKPVWCAGVPRRFSTFSWWRAVLACLSARLANEGRPRARESESHVSHSTEHGDF